MAAGFVIAISSFLFAAVAAIAQIWSLGRIPTPGIATLIVDKDYRAVLARADRALVLQKGVAVLSGPAAEIAADPALLGYLGV